MSWFGHGKYQICMAISVVKVTIKINSCGFRISNGCVKKNCGYK